MSQTQPDAVVLEKSSYDDADIDSQRVPALHRLAEKLGGSMYLKKPLSGPRRKLRMHFRYRMLAVQVHSVSL